MWSSCRSYFWHRVYYKRKCPWDKVGREREREYQSREGEKEALRAIFTYYAYIISALRPAPSQQETLEDLTLFALMPQKLHEREGILITHFFFFQRVEAGLRQGGFEVTR